MPDFLDLDPEFSRFDSAKYCILPIPYERTTTYGKGTAQGPGAILNASCQVELFDDELETEPFRAGISTLPPIEFPADLDSKECLDLVYRKATDLIRAGKFVLALGGEHSITFPLVRAFGERFSNLTVLQLDAHADLRPEYQGSPYSHACVMARVNELAPSIGVGIRSLSEEEYRIIKNKKMPVVFARKLNNNDSWIDEVMDCLGDPIYITLDVDYFDPSLMPSTGTPEPGGGSWYPTLQFLRRVFSEREVVGADVVELAPEKGRHAPDFLVAKFIYKMIGYRESRRQNKQVQL